MNKNKERSTVGSRIRPLLVGVGAGVGVGLLLMLATAAVMALVQVPAAVVTPMAMGVLAERVGVGGRGRLRFFNGDFGRGARSANPIT